ncbi:MAG TPA: hypothetical protein VK404_19150, partial [Spirosoma sp.]|nr:hypothetical protein [Spirosoma sp.]
MEIALLSLLFVLYLTIRFYLMDHDTPSEKDQKRFKKGIDMVTRRQLDQAYLYFDDAVRQHPKSAVAYAYRGKCHLAQENFYSALYDLTQAISRDN